MLSVGACHQRICSRCNALRRVAASDNRRAANNLPMSHARQSSWAPPPAWWETSRSCAARVLAARSIRSARAEPGADASAPSSGASTSATSSISSRASIASRGFWGGAPSPGGAAAGAAAPHRAGRRAGRPAICPLPAAPGSRSNSRSSDTGFRSWARPAAGMAGSRTGPDLLLCPYALGSGIRQVEGSPV